MSRTIKKYNKWYWCIEESLVVVREDVKMWRRLGAGRRRWDRRWVRCWECRWERRWERRWDQLRTRWGDAGYLVYPSYNVCYNYSVGNVMNNSQWGDWVDDSGWNVFLVTRCLFRGDVTGLARLLLLANDAKRNCKYTVKGTSSGLGSACKTGPCKSVKRLGFPVRLTVGRTQQSVWLQLTG
jgi:hypothetical protein